MKRDQGRDDALCALYAGGATMQEIADLVGISCERVRQILLRNGIVGGDPGSPGHDPVRILNACKHEQATTLHSVARISGCNESAVRRVLKELGRWEEFGSRWSAKKYDLDDLLFFLQFLAEVLGRTPTKFDIDEWGPPCCNTYQTYFGYLQDAQRLAGLSARYQGCHGKNRRGPWTKARLLGVVRETADKVGHSPTLREIQANGGPGSIQFTYYFGSWAEAQTAAGLIPNGCGWNNKPQPLPPNWRRAA